MTPRIFNFPVIVYGQATYTGDANNAPATSPCIASTVVTGPLTASIADQVLPPVNYSNTDQVSTGQLMLIVKDPRYTSAGWNVSVSCSAFRYSGAAAGGTTIPAAQFAITSIGPPVLISGQAIGAGGPLIGASGTGSLDQNRTVVLAQPGFGAGSYYIPIDVALTIPAQSQVGIYRAEITVTTTSGP
jgi:hypothetical protein